MPLPEPIKTSPKPKGCCVDKAVASIIQNPTLGEEKKGDLAGVFVYTFDCVNQLYLLAYKVEPSTHALLLESTHENFYRTIKRSGNWPVDSSQILQRAFFPFPLLVLFSFFYSFLIRGLPPSFAGF